MLLALFVSCKDKKSKIDPFAPITNLVDSALHRKDTVAVPVETGPVPTEADESFITTSFRLLRPMISFSISGRYFLCLTTT